MEPMEPLALDNLSRRLKQVGLDFRTPPSSTRSFDSRREWDDGAQRNGSTYEFTEDDDVEEPLMPHGGLPVAEWDREVARRLKIGPLRFVESTWFRMITGFVIIVNVIILVVWVVRPDLRAAMKVPEQVILTLYCVEILLSVGRTGRGFFLEMPEAIWNWLDLMTVVSGILDEWVLGVVGNSSGSGILFLALRCLRFLRVAWRFLRVFRLFRLLATSNTSWVESSRFQSFVAIVIVLNAIIMGFETDIDTPIWWWIEQVLLTFFVGELSLRLRHHGCTFFSDKEDRWWNLLDFIIVMMGVFDQWLIRLWEMLTNVESNSNLGQMMMLVRTMRLMRTLRLIRVVKAIRPLRLLAMGLIKVMQSMFWVLVLTFTALYTIAIFTTILIGKGSLVEDPELLPPRTRKMFSSLPNSIFTLFAFMNGQEWDQVRPLLNLLPYTKPVFVVFTIYSSWALLSVMTGVVSDHIQYVRERQLQEDEEARAEKSEQLRSIIAKIFAAADHDGSGMLKRDDYMELLNSPYQAARLQRVINQHVDDFRHIFDWLDTDGCGTVDFDELCDSLDWLGEPITGRRLLKVDSGVRLMCVLLQRSLENMHGDLAQLRGTCERQHIEAMTRLQEVFGQKDAHPLRYQRSLSWVTTTEAATSEESQRESLSLAASSAQPVLTGVGPAPAPSRLRYQRTQSSRLSAERVSGRLSENSELEVEDSNLDATPPGSSTIRLFKSLSWVRSDESDGSPEPRMRRQKSLTSACSATSSTSQTAFLHRPFVKLRRAISGYSIS